eukprot:3051918-Rhodomonas_salina.1
MACSAEARAASAAILLALTCSPLAHSARCRFLAACCVVLGRHVPSTSILDQPSEVRTERTSVPCLR